MSGSIPNRSAPTRRMARFICRASRGRSGRLLASIGGPWKPPTPSATAIIVSWVAPPAAVISDRTISTRATRCRGVSRSHRSAVRASSFMLWAHSPGSVEDARKGASCEFDQAGDSTFQRAAGEAPEDLLLQQEEHQQRRDEYQDRCGSHDALVGGEGTGEELDTDGHRVL